MGKKPKYPTPCSRDYKGANSLEHVQKGNHINQLANFVKYSDLDEESKKVTWRTPKASSHGDSKYNEDFLQNGVAYRPSGNPVELTLENQVKMRTFPTPGCTGLSNGSGNCEKANKLYDQGIISEEERKTFRAGNGGQLNPDWTEWLMGWPVGWTGLERMSQEELREWKRQMLDASWWKIDPAEEGTLSRLTEDKTHRADRIKAIGNGQVPTCVLAMTVILEKENKE